MENRFLMTKKSKNEPLFLLPLTVNGYETAVTLTSGQLSELVNVSKKTARRWIDGTQRPHPHTLELLRIKVLGLIPDPAFDGFRVENGKLYLPQGGAVTPDDLEQLVWLRGLYHRGLKDIDRRKEEINALFDVLPHADLLRRKAQKRKNTY